MLAEAHIYFGVALAGLASFLSPCVLPLVPPYLGFLGGTTIEELSAEGGVEGRVWRRVIATAVLFVLGFTTVFVSLGAGASVFGQFIQTYRSELAMVAGVFIILFGLHFLGVLRIPLLYKEARYHAEPRGATYLGAYLIGLAFAFGWTPCVGPILATVLALAADQGSVTRGVQLLFVYSLGLGIPFILAAVAVRPFLSWMKRMRGRLAIVEKAMGVVLVLTGIAFLTGSVNLFGQWMIETFPALAEIEERVVPKSLPTEIMKQGLGR